MDMKFANFRPHIVECCATCKYHFKRYIQGSQPSNDYCEDYCEPAKKVLNKPLWTVCNEHKLVSRNQRNSPRFK